jgi:hypothetical protein
MMRKCSVLSGEGITHLTFYQSGVEVETLCIRFIKRRKNKMVPLHAIEELGERGGIAPTLS